MCEDAVRNETRTGAVNSGRVAASCSDGSKSRNRQSHLTDPTPPPNSLWLEGVEDMIAAMREIAAYIQAIEEKEGKTKIR